MKYYLMVTFLLMVSLLQPLAAQETQEDSSWSEVGQGIKSTSGKAWDATKSTSSDAWDATKSGSGEAWDATKKFSSDTWQKISD